MCQRWRRECRGPGGSGWAQKPPQCCCSRQWTRQGKARGVQTTRNQEADHLMDTDSTEQNQRGGDASDPDDSVNSAASASRPGKVLRPAALWVCKAKPAQSRAEEMRAGEPGAVRRLELLPEAPIPHPGAGVARGPPPLRRPRTPHSLAQVPGTPRGFSQGRGHAGRGPRAAGRGASPSQAGLSNVTVWGWCTDKRRRGIPEGRVTGNVELLTLQEN